MLQEVKEYLKIDNNEEDNLINTLISATEEYLKKSGVNQPEGESPLYKLAVKMLVAARYEKRNIFSNSQNTFDTLAQSIIIQLSL